MTVEHLRKVSELTRQLANIGVVVPDEELVDRVLTSLPPSWEVFRCMASNREMPYSLSKLKGRLLAEDAVRIRNKDDDESVMMAQSNFQPKFNCGGSNFSPRFGTRRTMSYHGRTNFSTPGRGNLYTENFGSGHRGYNPSKFFASSQCPPIQINVRLPLLLDLYRRLFETIMSLLFSN